MINVTIDVELVESLMSLHTQYTGSVLLQEIKSAMETYIKNGLERGCKVSLQQSFDNAWTELVLMEVSEESLSDLDEEF
jgi:hypothetical protein